MLGQCIESFTSSYGLPASLFIGGLVGGFSHCTWMCGSFVIAQADNNSPNFKISSSLLIPYHLGRMTTYVLIAILVSSIVNLAFVFSDLKVIISAPLLITAGLMFLVSAFPKLSNIFPWVLKIKIGVPYKYISGFVSRLSDSRGILGRYSLGVLLGFMPCGLVISALMASASAPSVFQSAIAMAAFTIGTIPALIIVALGGQSFKYRYPKASIYVSRGGMIVSSIWLFALAGMMFL